MPLRCPCGQRLGELEHDVFILPGPAGRVIVAKGLIAVRCEQCGRTYGVSTLTRAAR